MESMTKEDNACAAINNKYRTFGIFIELIETQSERYREQQRLMKRCARGYIVSTYLYQNVKAPRCTWL